VEGRYDDAVAAEDFMNGAISLGVFAMAAAAEIAGCFAFWAWLRLGKTGWWALPGIAALIVFALLLTRADSLFAGRAYAAYGGVYIAASLVWLMLFERQMPDRWDGIGAVLCLIGAGIILLAPRPA
jgi:small multidrug resistance family-3 protein